MVDSPTSRSSCLGVSFVLAGQNRVPVPPAMMIAWSMTKNAVVKS
jgi:hypothetical protein